VSRPFAIKTAFPCLTLFYLLSAAAFSSGCAVRSVYVKPDFEKVDRLNLKRVAVAATPLSQAPPRVAHLLARIARRYIHQHKDYLVLGDTVIKQAARYKSLCKDGIQGVVRVMVEAMEQDSDHLTVEMAADLLRCDSGAVVWRVEIRDRNEQRDDDLKELAGVYLREFGAVATKYAAPLFIVVKAAFESLPSPQLTDEETMEKISMDDS